MAGALRVSSIGLGFIRDLPGEKKISIRKDGNSFLVTQVGTDGFREIVAECRTRDMARALVKYLRSKQRRGD